ncbi:hypothetical protein [Stenotrophomonas maltophilia]|uniref:hypothetical protein n=2 Tax=Lysobacteraceae TaxID=32033 RepID=UPI000C157918|nr:hypothetical protein [Stenotrophomonas maltophilia]MBH1482502.1 hypothetical protein [Stenotrophomonas maltophilia]MCU1064372.1 hypothetical protein [Stenotrophomonas maltophilia]HDS1530701.1 hypothetical protein [Stenotrophomonas maltophilia]
METAVPGTATRKTVFRGWMGGLFAVLVACPSLAHGTNCDSKVANVSIDASGKVFVATTASPIHAVCNIVSKGDFSMPTEVCKATYAMLMSAKVSAIPIRLYYTSVPQCGDIKAWSAQPSFYHAELF